MHRSQVFDEPALVNLQGHLLSDRRALPILVVGPGHSSNDSRCSEQPQCLDARSMAQQLCGLAHVVCLGPMVLALLESRLGSDMGLGIGEARFCLPAAGEPAAEGAGDPPGMCRRHCTCRRRHRFRSPVGHSRMERLTPEANGLPPPVDCRRGSLIVGPRTRDWLRDEAFSSAEAAGST